MAPPADGPNSLGRSSLRPSAVSARTVNGDRLVGDDVADQRHHRRARADPPGTARMKSQNLKRLVGHLDAA